MYAAWWEGFVDETGAPDPNGTYLNRLWYANDDTSRVTNADLLLEGHVNWGRSAHTLLFGVDGMKNDADQRTWLEDYATPLDVYNPVYGTYPEPDWDNLPTDFAQTRVTAVGLLVQDQIKLDERWVFVAGVRYDTASTDTDTMFSDGSTNSGRPGRRRVQRQSRHRLSRRWRLVALCELLAVLRAGRGDGRLRRGVQAQARRAGRAGRQMDADAGGDGDGGDLPSEGEEPAHHRS